MNILLHLRTRSKIDDAGIGLGHAMLTLVLCIGLLCTPVFVRQEPKEEERVTRRKEDEETPVRKKVRHYLLRDSLFRATGKGYVNSCGVLVGEPKLAYQ